MDPFTIPTPGESVFVQTTECRRVGAEKTSGIRAVSAPLRLGLRPRMLSLWNNKLLADFQRITRQAVGFSQISDGDPAAFRNRRQCFARRHDVFAASRCGSGGGGGLATFSATHRCEFLR